MTSVYFKILAAPWKTSTLAYLYEIKATMIELLLYLVLYSFALSDPLSDLRYCTGKLSPGHIYILELNLICAHVP